MDFQPTDLEDAQKMIRIMYGRPFSVLVVPKHSVLKKIVYSIKVDMKMVGIDRVSMASLAAGPSDTALLRLRRYLVGHMLACAGTALVPGAMYDGGFGGVHASFPTQYLSWFDCCDLLETFETSVACLAVSFITHQDSSPRFPDDVVVSETGPWSAPRRSEAEAEAQNWHTLCCSPKDASDQLSGAPYSLSYCIVDFADQTQTIN